jgi:hypothetical protein
VLYFLGSQVIDVISHAIKESLVRSQPMNQEKFNLKIAISQFLIGLAITPLILQFSVILIVFLTHQYCRWLWMKTVSTIPSVGTKCSESSSRTTSLSGSNAYLQARGGKIREMIRKGTWNIAASVTFGSSAMSSPSSSFRLASPQ